SLRSACSWERDSVVGRWIVSTIVLLLGRGRAKPRVESAPKDPRAETAAVALLFLSALLAVGFIVVYAVDSIPDQTQLLGAALGLSLMCIAAALVIVGKRLVVTEELVEPYPPEEHPG